MVPPAGLEPTTPRLGIWCSILLSYGGTVSNLFLYNSLLAVTNLAQAKFFPNY